MDCRSKFIEDLKCNVIIKGDQTFTELARLYGYPEENGANLCKKDYYKFLDDCKKQSKIKPSVDVFMPDELLMSYKSKGIASTVESAVKAVSTSKVLENLTLKSQWEAQGKGGEIITLKSYTNNVNPVILKQFRNDIVEDIKNYTKPNGFYYSDNTAKDNILIISLPDYHVARHKDYEESSNLYLESILRIFASVDMSKIEKVLYIIGNDLFNSDNVEYRTTRGTQQFDYLNWKESWKYTNKLVLDSIELLKETALVVDIIFVPGNHDQSKIYFLEDVVKAYYHNDAQVNIIGDENIFKNYVWGNSLLVFEHGEMKEADYPLIVASEFPKQWGDSTYRYVFCGHLHHTIVKEYRGNLFVKYLPSLSKSSDWEKSRGYRTCPKAEANIINKDLGLINTITINI